MPQQAVMDINPPQQQCLDNLVVGPNAELLNDLLKQRNGFRGFWIWGRPGSGKSHLVRGYCLALHDQGEDFSYVDAATSNSGLGALQRASEYGSTVVVENVSLLAQEPLALELLMSLYQRLYVQHGTLIVTDQLSASAIEFPLADVNSRLRSLSHYQMLDLDDDDKAQVLKERALHWGYELSDQVLQYWLTHGPRQLDTLLIDLERLDRAALSRRQLVTIPLLKSELGY